MLVYGKQPVLYLLERHAQRVKKLYLAKEIEQKQFSSFHKLGVEMQRIPANAAQSMAKGGNHQGFLCEVEEPALLSLHDIKHDSFVLVLSELTDVGNMGAILRTAYALGVDSVVITGIKHAPLEGLARTSSGALFDSRIVHYENILDVMNELKMGGFTLYGATMQGRSAQSIVYDQKRCLIMGSEDKGLSARVLKKLDVEVSIEMKHNFNSLNVSVAAGILIDRMG